MVKNNAVPVRWSSALDPVLQRELEYHDELYSGFAQQHFAKPAVRAFRAHLARRILSKCPLGTSSRVLSLGCGIGDTELLLAPHVAEVVGVDLSATGIRQAEVDARKAGVKNARFVCGAVEDAGRHFDAIIAVFFLHHLSDDALGALPRKIYSRLNPAGVFYALDPSRQRLSGWIGRRLCPRLMDRYQTEDERELDGRQVASLFRSAMFDCQGGYYDFLSTPLAGLAPAQASAYHVARAADDVLIHIPGLRCLGSNFELVAKKRGGPR